MHDGDRVGWRAYHLASGDPNNIYGPGTLYNADAQPLASRLDLVLRLLARAVEHRGALREVGLPQVDVPLALLFFNVGVEAGQLLFIAVVVALLAGLARMAGRATDAARDVWARLCARVAAHAHSPAPRRWPS